MVNQPQFSASRLDGYAIIPMLTPFNEDGSLDRESVSLMTGHILGGGCQGIMISGTTGEAVSMNKCTRIQLIDTVKKSAEGRCMLLFGIGHNCLEQSVSLARTAFESGVDGVVAHLPAYYELSPVQMEAWFNTLADRIEGPVFIYNIPQTTKTSIPVDVLERLSLHPRIVGLKDSERDEERQLKLARCFADREDFAFFTGYIAASSCIMQAGARGFVPAVGNFFPTLAREIMKTHVLGDYAAYETLLEHMMSIASVFQGTRNVADALAAMKATAAVLELCKPHVLPPLRTCGESELNRIRAELETMKLIPSPLTT